MLKIREYGIAALMEASNGEPQQRGQSADFSSKRWRRAAIKKLNIAIVGHKFVDDLGGHRPDLGARELPFSMVQSDDFNAMMELGFPGYLAESGAIKDRVDAIRDSSLSEVPGPGNPDPGSY